MTMIYCFLVLFFFNDTATTEIYTLSLHDALPISLEILEHLPPKSESAYFLLCAFTYTSDFMGGCPPLPLSEKRVSLQIQLIIPGCDSVSTYKLLWKSSSLPE